MSYAECSGHDPVDTLDLLGVIGPNGNSVDNIIDVN